MGFSLQEAQWLVKFYQGLPGRARAAAEAEQGAQYMDVPQDHGDYGYSDYQTAGYDDYR